MAMDTDMGSKAGCRRYGYGYSYRYSKDYIKPPVYAL